MAKFRRKARRWNHLLLRLAGPAIAIVLIAGASFFGDFGSRALSNIKPPAFAQQRFAAEISVTDGDTVRVSGQPVRLVGFNAPETFRSACQRELELGNRATRRLEELVATGDVDFVSVPCSCPPGTEGTSQCNYGRACGTLRTNGTDVGSVLISEGLAVPFHCGATSCPRLPRPWCG